MSQVRAFLAIDLDDDLKPKINKVIRQFKPIDAKIKYVELLNIHLTLKFFGEIDTDGLEVLENAIENVVSEFEPFNIKIGGCGAFPNTNRIRVIWIGIEDDALIRKLHDRLDKEFVKLGLDKDRKFSTHITIGRMKSPKNKDKVKATIEECKDVEIGEMTVDRIALKKSTLTPQGPIYEDLKVFEL